MSKPFDATLKELIDNNPDDWVRLSARSLGLPNGIKAEAINADLSTVSPQADKLFRLSGPVDALLHLEIQSSWDATLPDRALVYSVFAEHRLGLPVYTVVVLLHARAQSRQLTGELQRRYADGREYLTFRYSIMRVWELSVDELMSGGIGTLPLALLTDEAARDPEAAVKRFEQRVEQEAGDAKRQAQVESTAFILMGLRFDKALVTSLFREVVQMKDSSTYQHILQEGMAEGLEKGLSQGLVEGMHQMLVMSGEARWGAIMPAQQSAPEAITDTDRLKRMGKRLIEASNWDELLATK